ncbi:MAG: hypothetical protein K5770_16360 [Lachnospiraceae bacterium]|nr:hypothetical protein [Lachnospiraceae bacterium]
MTIGLYGIAMIVLIAILVFYPLMPFYAMGYMLGTCLPHSFVMEDEKEEYRQELEEAIERERSRSRNWPKAGRRSGRRLNRRSMPTGPKRYFCLMSAMR